MDLNIINYIIESKKLNQTKIGKLLEVGAKQTKDGKIGHVTQAQVSKWRNGEKTPKGRELELIEIAGLNEHNQFTLDNADSQWALLMHFTGRNSEKLWMQFIEELVYKKQVYSFQTRDIICDGELVDWTKNILFMLNEVGITLYSPPYSIGCETDYPALEETNLWDFIDALITKTASLQKRFFRDIPSGLLKSPISSMFFEEIPRIALKYLTVGPYKLSFREVDHDPFSMFGYGEEVTETVEAFIKELVKEASIKNVEFDPLKPSRSLGGSCYDDSLIIKNTDIAEDIPFSKASSNPYEEVLESSTADQTEPSEVDDFSYLSLGERKILEGVRKNEELLNELLRRINSRNDMEIPF